MHVGQKLSELLVEKRMTRQELGRLIGVTGSAVTYLVSRGTFDVETLQKIGNVLKYNFFKHYPVEEDAEEMAAGVESEKKLLIAKIMDLEKNLEQCKRDLMMQKQENGYLKKINDLLEKKTP